MRKIILSILAISFAIFSVGMGIWQLRRLSARQKLNAAIAARRFVPETELDALPADTGLAHFRRVHIKGSYDHANEIIEARVAAEASTMSKGVFGAAARESRGRVDDDR